MTNRTYKTGPRREQLSLLPPRVEDYVAQDNPVRAIEAYVCALDLEKLGFRHAGGGTGAGQPSYHPADLLKAYLYGYLNRVRSSRRLEQEAQRNLELMWLLKGLTPGYRTIANFRRDNWSALKATNREFVLLLRELELLGGKLVAIDGAFFHGDASKASIKTKKRLAEQLACIDRDIEEYGKALASNDASEEAHSSGDGDGGSANGNGGRVADKLAALMARRAKAQADLDRLEDGGETQLSTTDADARLLSKRGHVLAGYNVQIAVDDKHKLIVASEVVNDGNDTGQLYEVAKAAKEALGAETLQAIADTGYYNGTTLKECEEGGIVAYVPPPKRTGGLEEQGRFTHEAFSYDAEADAYRCPAGALLRPMNGVKISPAGRQDVRYVSLKSVCKACHLREQCLGQKSDKRTIYRWQHEEVIDRHRERMKEASELMRQRSCLVEHPFGTLKCRAGYRHFLVRGFAKVRGEWSLMALCYNLARVLNILGFDGFVAFFANRVARSAILRVLCAVVPAIGPAIVSIRGLSAKLGQKPAIIRFRFSIAA
ncbi:transposase [Bradyrhizobium sp. S3.2.6]|uniref:IS1182 family transposase n=1 Tax=unclassified Bradyrhizobium TaxID=2631580 RepID=UPI0033937BF4